MSRNDVMRVVRLQGLLERGKGSPGITVGIIDGPVAVSHPNLAESSVRFIPEGIASGCRDVESFACRHGTFVAGLMAANRHGEPSGICPGCTFLVRPLFREVKWGEDCPEVTPEFLAESLEETMDAGARIINLSLGLESSSLRRHPRLKAAYDRAEREGVILVGASGNQGIIGESPLFAHPWIIPVVSCDLQGRALSAANSGVGIAQGGLMAPGKDISGVCSTGGTTSMTGTSVAAPFVTGTLALLWSLYPEMPATLLREAVLRLPGRANRLFPPLLDAEAALRNMEAFSLRSKPLRQVQRMNYVQSIGDQARFVSQNRVGIVPQGKGTVSCSSDELSDTDLTAQKSSLMGYVYAVGSLSALFPNKGLEQEFNRVAGISNSTVPDNKLMFSILSQDEYRYLAEEMRWVLSINNVKTYSVNPGSGIVLDEMIQSLNQTGGQTSYQTVIGPRGPMASTKTAGSEQLPTVLCSQFYNFTFNEFVNNIAKETGADIDVVGGLFQQLLGKTDNSGATDENRAINYIALRYLDIYKMANEQIKLKKPLTLDSIEGEPARVMGMRRIVDVVFQYQERGSEKVVWKVVKVDATGLFPFLLSEVDTNQPRP